MHKWVANMIIAVVLVFWSVAMGLTIWHTHSVPALQYWTPPGATYLVLKSRITSIMFGGGTAEVGMGEEKKHGESPSGNEDHHG